LKENLSKKLEKIKNWRHKEKHGRLIEEATRWLLNHGYEIYDFEHGLECFRIRIADIIAIKDGKFVWVECGQVDTIYKLDKFFNEHPEFIEFIHFGYDGKITKFSRENMPSEFKCFFNNGLWRIHYL